MGRRCCKIQSCRTEGSLNSRTPPASYTVEAQGEPQAAAVMTDTSCSSPEARCFEVNSTKELEWPGAGVMPPYSPEVAELISSCERLSAEQYPTVAFVFILRAMAFSFDVAGVSSNCGYAFRYCCPLLLLVPEPPAFTFRFAEILCVPSTSKFCLHRTAPRSPRCQVCAMIINRIRLSR